MADPLDPAPEPGTAQPARSAAAPRRRKRSTRRHNPWVDRGLIAAGVLCAGLVALAILAQQRKVTRMAEEVAVLRAAAGAPAAAPAASAASAPRPITPVDATPRPTAPLPDDALARFQTACDDLAPSFAQYQRQFLAPMHYWGSQALSDLPTQRITYLFAGPDSATAASLFPRAQHLVLVANQVLDPAASAPASPQVNAAECRIWRFFARMGYFRTHDLDGRGGARPRIEAMLIQGLRLADLSVTGAEYLRLQADGQVLAADVPAGQRPFGLRLHAQRPDASRLVLDYLTIDLSDAALSRNADQAAALERLLGDTVLLKAASHLPQEPSFSLVARWTAERAPAVVQDETGLSVQDLRSAFAVRYYGQFTQAHQLWRNKAQPKALQKDVAAAEVEPLLFTFGYEKPSGSLVIVATRQKAAERP